jgi:hypothetical protein
MSGNAHEKKAFLKSNHGLFQDILIEKLKKKLKLQRQRLEEMVRRQHCFYSVGCLKSG